MKDKRLLSSALVILLSVLMLSMGDLMEIIPLFAPAVASPFFPFFHEIHDLLALGIALYAAYKYHTRLGVASVLLFYAAHTPYFIAYFPQEAPELLRNLFSGFVALFGIWLINRLHKNEERLRASEERIRQQNEFLNSVLESLPYPFYVVDASDYTIKLANSAAQMGDLSENLTCYALTHGKSKPCEGGECLCPLEEVKKIKKPVTAEHVHYDKAGNPTNVEVYGYPIFDTEGNVIQMIEYCIDITERKLADERITHLTAVLRALRNVNQLITHEKDRESLIQKSCDLLVQRKGYEQGWILLLDENRNFVTAASSGLGENAPAFLKQLETGNYPVCLRGLLAQEQAFIAYDQPGKQHQGCILADEHSRQGVFRCKLEYESKLYGVLGVTLPSDMVSDKEEQGLFLELCGDIAFALANIEREEKRRQAEEALRVSEERYRTLVENALAGVFRTNLQGDVLYVNNAVVSMFSFNSAEEMIASGAVVRYKNPSDRAILLKELAEKGKVNSFELELLTKTGEIKNVIINAVLEGDTLSGMLLDITERQQAEEQIEQAAREWQTTFDSISEWVSVHDKDFKIIRANKAFTDFLKMKPEEVIGRHCYELIHGEREASQYCSHKEALETGKPAYKEFFNPHLGIHMEVVCSPLFDERGEITSTVHIGRDITERKRMEARLMVTDRLASVGELASGIAHELNNPLTGVIGLSQLLLERVTDESVKEDLKLVNSEAQRAANVVKNMLTFARKHPVAKQLVNVHNIIQKVLDLRAYEQRVSNIEVVTRFAPDLPEIIADDFQLQQVFFNIIINAEYFMIQAHNKGILTIATARAGDFVRASFSDDGPGIPKGNLGYVFDPFFTTKEVGKGTGLGLSICHGIVTAHGGRISVESELGKGATFVVELPLGYGEEMK